MTYIFEEHEIIDTSQAIDYFENGFLRAVFRAMSGKDVLDNVPEEEISLTRESLFKTAIDNLTTVANKAIHDNPLDTLRIIEMARYRLGNATGRIAEKFNQVECESEMVQVVDRYAKNVKFQVSGEREALAYAKIFDAEYKKSSSQANAVVDSMISTISRFKDQKQGMNFVIDLLLGHSENSPEVIKSGMVDYEAGNYITQQIIPLRVGSQHIAPQQLH